MDDVGTLQYSDISLGTRSGATPGHLDLRKSGLHWRRNSGGRDENISTDEIEDVLWTRVSRGYQLGIRRKGKPTINFLGFRESDRASLEQFLTAAFGRELKDVHMSSSGRNWGAVVVNGTSLMFSVEGQPAFEVPIPEVSQAQSGKEELMLEFHVDDTTVQENEDALTEMAFHIPDDNPDIKTDADDDQPAARMFYEQIVNFTDAPIATDDVVVSFEDVGIEVPRGRFVVEMHLSFLRLIGQTQDFKIRFSSIHRLLLLPRPGTPHFNVIISLETPLRKGQTFYQFVICRFVADEEGSYQLEMTKEQMAKKNGENGGKLAEEMQGPVHEIFAQLMRGLYGAKITRASKNFRSKEGQPAVRCAYKADDGFLYPLERAFYYGHKPPILIPHEDIISVEFMRHGGGVQQVRTFDLLLRLRNEVEHQFRNIERQEWDALLKFLQEKDIKIDNLSQARAGPAGAGMRQGLSVDGGDIDPGFAAYTAGMGEDEEDEDDEDFDEAGSRESESSEDSSNESDAEMVAEGEIGADLDSRKRSKPPSSSSKPPKAPSEAPQKKRPRKTRDKNAPKGALNAYQLFVQQSRESVASANPDASATDIVKLCAERWKQISSEEKRVYEELAKKDKERFARESAEYKASLEAQGEQGGSGAQGGD